MIDDHTLVGKSARSRYLSDGPRSRSPSLRSHDRLCESFTRLSVRIDRLALLEDDLLVRRKGVHHNEASDVPETRAPRDRNVQLPVNHGPPICAPVSEDPGLTVAIGVHGVDNEGVEEDIPAVLPLSELYDEFDDHLDIAAPDREGPKDLVDDLLVAVAVIRCCTGCGRQRQCGESCNRNRAR